jgi:hypothetical protein
LALRSLLDATDDSGRAALTMRVAALCAEEAQRKSLQRRLELAFALEHWVMGGGGADAYLESLGPDTARSIVLEVEQHVRALLRDVLCGYLSADLKAVADDLLLTGDDLTEVREEPAARSPRPAEPEPEPEPEPEQPQLDAGVTPSADWELDDDPASYSAPI